MAGGFAFYERLPMSVFSLESSSSVYAERNIDV
jgi:hypothetical protein